MTTAAVVTLVVAALIVAAAALGLLRVIFHLVAVRKSLTALEGGVQVIVAKTSSSQDPKRPSSAGTSTSSRCNRDGAYKRLSRVIV